MFFLFNVLQVLRRLLLGWLGYCGFCWLLGCGLWGIMPVGTLATERAAEKPAERPAERIASLDVCTDQIVLLLAKKTDIVGLSTLAQDCKVSVLCQQAQHVPILPAHAEAILQVRPSVLFVGPFKASMAQFVARVLGTKVVIVSPALSLADVAAHIMLVAQALGQDERGKQLVVAFQEQLQRLTVPVTDSSPRAILYEANGFVMPVGSLADDVLTHAGMRNAAPLLGVGSVARRVSLETILLNKPDFLVRDESARGYSLAQAMLNAPLLLAAFPPSHVVDIPARLWLCGLPQTLEALARLRRARDHYVYDQVVVHGHSSRKTNSLTILPSFPPLFP